MDFRELCEKFKPIDKNVKNLLIDTLILYKEDIFGQEFTLAQKKTYIKETLKDMEIDYSPNHKKLKDLFEYWEANTESRQQYLLYSEVFPRYNPSNFNPYHMFVFEKDKNIKILSTHIELNKTPFVTDTFLNCAQSEPHEFNRIMGQISKSVNSNSIINGRDYELIGKVETTTYELNFKGILQKYVDNYTTGEDNITNYVLPILLLNTDIETFKNMVMFIIDVYSDKIINIAEDESNALYPTEYQKHYDLFLDFVTFFRTIYKNNVYYLFESSKEITKVENTILGGFSLYNKRIEPDVFGLFNVYIKATFRNFGLTKLIFDKIDLIIGSGVTIFASTKSEAMRKRFTEYFWENIGCYVPEIPGDIFTAQERVYIKGPKKDSNVVVKIFEDKYVNEEIFKTYRNMIHANPDAGQVKSLSELTYNDLYLQKDVTFIGKLPTESKLLFNLKQYDIFPGLKEVDVDFLLYLFIEPKTDNHQYFTIPNYEGNHLKFNKQVKLIPLNYDIDYNFNNKEEIEFITKTKVDNIVKILEKVYSNKDYTFEEIPKINHLTKFKMDLNLDLLFRQDFIFIDSSTEWDSFKEYIKEFKNDYGNLNKLVILLFSYQIHINNIEKVLKKKIEELKKLNQSQFSYFDNFKVDYNIVDGFGKIDILYNHTSINFLYVLTYIMFIEEKLNANSKKDT